MRCRPLWLGTQKRVEEWRQLGASEYLCRAVQFGIYEAPCSPFVSGEGEELSDIPQSQNDRELAAQDLGEGCKKGIYEEITFQHAQRAKKQGDIISSAFTVWQEKEEG